MHKLLLPFGLIALLAGCRTEQTEIIEKAYPVIEISSKWVEFGLAESDAPVSRTIVITNSGDLPLGISSIAEGKGMEGNFTFSYDAANISCPVVEGEDTGSEATAKGVAPPGPELSVSTSEVDFGTVKAGSAEVEYVTLTNTGDSALSITKATIVPSDGPFSMVTDPSGTSIAAGASSVVVLQYLPTDTAGDEATLVFVTDGDPAVAEVALLGNQGGSSGDSGLDDTDEPTDDSDEPTDDTGEDPGDGEVLFVLDAGCKIPVDITLAPVDIGEIYSSLIIETKTQSVEEGDPAYWSDVDHNKNIVYLQGEAEKGVGRLIVTPRSVPFNHVWTGEEEARYVRVQNAGDGDLTLYQPTLDSTCDPAFSITYSYAESATDTKVLGAGESSLVEITFIPEDQKEAYCTLNVASDDASNPTIPVYIQGNTGSDPDNEAPTVYIRSPEAGYVHNSVNDIELEINVFDANQPAQSLSCKVNSTINVQANVADCTPADESGHVFVSIPVEEFEPGVDTLVVRVTDAAGVRSQASVSILYSTPYPESDDDGDGFGTEDTGILLDCDDANTNSYPYAAEIYDGLDNDCDALIDEGTTGADDDGDSFSEALGDCDDTDEDSYPGAPESPDYKDNDCDDEVDENTTLRDDDGDGFAEVNNDCNDLKDDISPSAVELCDNIDNDCNGRVDDGCLSLDSEPIIIGGVDLSRTACEVGETVQMSSFIYDSDGEQLFYTWTVENGSAPDLTSSTISWTAQTELTNDDGELVQIYVVAQDESGHQVWDFTQIAVYPVGTLTEPFVEIVTVESEGACSTGGGTPAGAALAGLGLALAMVRRRR